MQKNKSKHLVRLAAGLLIVTGPAYARDGVVPVPVRKPELVQTAEQTSPVAPVAAAPIPEIKPATPTTTETAPATNSVQDFAKNLLGFGTNAPVPEKKPEPVAVAKAPEEIPEPKLEPVEYPDVAISDADAKIYKPFSNITSQNNICNF